MPPVAPSPYPGADLVEVIEGALAREGHLFTSGEAEILRRLLRLPPEARELWARLSLRGGDTLPVFRVASLRYQLDLPAALAVLEAEALIHTRLPDDRCLSAFDVPALKAACVRLGLPTGGPRATLEERLRGRRWVDEPVVLLAHRGLVRRAELLWFQRPWMDRSSLVMERVGAVRWPAYTPTGGSGLFLHRRALLTWERARAGDWHDPEEPLRLALAGRGEAPLSPWRRAVQAVLAGAPGADIVGRLVVAGAPIRPEWALALEREGRTAEAIAACRDPAATPGEAVALERTGRRLSRTARQGWAPRAPLREAPVRGIRVTPGPKRGARPTWRVAGEEHFVEAAMVALLGTAGREALHAENWLWTSLYALVFRELYFLPVPGTLPTARRDGPLDVGTPAFYARRRESIEARLRALREEGPRGYVDGWSGERLAGLWAAETVRSLCARIPGGTAAAILSRLAHEGWSAARGLPDLYVLPGPEVRLPETLPSRLLSGDLLAEVKGPGDTLRDEQRVWHAHLLGEGIPVELWEVTPSSRETA